MKKNFPVTDTEYILGEHETIVSKTDLKGKITYVNSDFIRISGYSSDELIGAPQNILRHPDMPAAAFADLWRTIRNGKAWTGLVKNRCKNGDYYWVEANVAPLLEGGAVVGYTSIRVKPGRRQVDAAEQDYRKIREGTSAIGVNEGAILRGAAVKRKRFRTAAGSRTWYCAVLTGLLMLFAMDVAAAGEAGPSATSITASIAGMLLAVFAGWSLHKETARPVGQLKEHIRNMSAGDLSSRIEASGDGTMGELFHGLRVLQVNLKVLIGQIREAAIVVNGGAHGIVAGNTDLSARTESQASALEETASSMEELTSTVRQTAENANEANRLVACAAETAVSGGRAVDQVIETMGSIRDSSHKVGEIIDVINGIAFQSNILALNAAVEAARAGEHGRGFAVVAHEVRALSLRSAAAAQEIGVLIGDSVRKVEEGQKLVDAAGKTMRQVVGQVQQVAGYMNDIRDASREQSLGIEQVNQAILQMDGVTQQNASLVERAAAASANMLQQAGELADLVNRFRLMEARRHSASEPKLDLVLALDAPARQNAG